MKVFKNLKAIFFGSLPRGFTSSYLLVMIIGAVLLSLPISLQNDSELALIDAFFIASSAISTTGLTPVVIQDVFSPLGKIVLLLITQFGGIGLIMAVAMFWLLIRQKITFKQRNMIMTDQNQVSREGIVRFLRHVIIMIFLIEWVGFVILSIHLVAAQYYPVGEALFQAMFLSISLFTNAGFDITAGSESLVIYRDDYVVQTVAMVLISLGAVGFWPLAEFKQWVEAKFKKEKFKFSYFSKLLFRIHMIVLLAGALFIYLLERDLFLADSSVWDTIFVSFFTSVTTRNAGFSTINIAALDGSTHFLIMFLMFVGASPNSVGGGVRTITFLVALLGIKSFALGRTEVVLHERTIKQETVFKAMVVIIMAFLWVGLNTQFILIVEDLPFESVLFEVMSAFGTTGLSLGITSELSVLSKASLVVTMFIGRIGLASLLLFFKPVKSKVSNIKYPEMDLIVG